MGGRGCAAKRPPGYILRSVNVRPQIRGRHTCPVRAPEVRPAQEARAGLGPEMRIPHPFPGPLSYSRKSQPTGLLSRPMGGKTFAPWGPSSELPRLLCPDRAGRSPALVRSGPPSDAFHCYVTPSWNPVTFSASPLLLSRVLLRHMPNIRRRPPHPPETHCAGLGPRGRRLRALRRAERGPLPARLPHRTRFSEPVASEWRWSFCV